MTKNKFDQSSHADLHPTTVGPPSSGKAQYTLKHKFTKSLGIK